jgi:GTPase SAR1 family protein
MNLAHQSRKILVTGQSGQGKSTYFARFLSHSFKTFYDKIFVYDHIGEMAYRLNIAPALSVDDLSRQWEEGFICYDPAEMFPGETDSGWNFYCEWVFDRCRNNLGMTKLIAVDELQLFSSTAQLSWEQCCVVETGRKYELDFLGISQQMNLVHNRLRNQLTELVSFRQEEQLIIDALEERGFSPEVLRSLKKGEFIGRNFQTGDTFTGTLNLTQQTTRVDYTQHDGSDKTLAGESEPVATTGQIENAN